MNRLCVPLLGVIVVGSISSPAYAQNRGGIGIGLSRGELIPNVLELTLAPASIYVPFDFGNLRVEPEIGLVRGSSEEGQFEISTTLFQLGIGLFAARPIGSSSVYYGGRFGITTLSSRTDSPTIDSDDSSTNFFVGPALGAEHNFSEHFSLGGEAQLIYTAIGSDEDDDDSSTSLIRTRPIFFVRWYF